MVLLLSEIHNYQQLAKVNNRLASEVQQFYAKIFAAHGVTPSEETRPDDTSSGGNQHGSTRPAGTNWSMLGDIGTVNPARVADLAYRLYRYLNGKRGDIFDFVILVVDIDDQDPHNMADRAQNALLMSEDDNSIWFDSSTRKLLHEFFEFEKGAHMWKFLKTKTSSQYLQVGTQIACLRPAVVEMILDKITQRLNMADRAPGLLLVGSYGVGKNNSAEEAANLLVGKKSPAAPVHLFTLFRRQSPIHPFLNSLDPIFLKKVPSFLSKSELKSWKMKNDLLAYLKSQVGQRRCFDRLFQDFFSAYSLYLAAYCNMMERNLLPALFICEDIETYHADCMHAVTQIVKNFMHRPSFIPIFITSENEIPDILGDLDLDRLAVNPAGCDEVKTIAQRIYPEIEFSSETCARIQKLTGGKPVPILHYLYYLRSNGKIALENDSYRWGAQADNDFHWLANIAALTGSVLTSLDANYRDLLYAIHLSGALIGREDFWQFLDFVGVDKKGRTDALSYLAYEHKIRLDLVK